MFAVIKTGGKQYKVSENDIVDIEKVDGKKGDKVTFDTVVMTGSGKDVNVGSPVVSGASVKGEIVEQTRGDKIVVFKKKRRQNYRRTKGHRQHYTRVKITDLPGGSSGAKKASSAKKEAAASSKTKTATKTKSTKKE